MPTDQDDPPVVANEQVADQPDPAAQPSLPETSAAPDAVEAVRAAAEKEKSELSERLHVLELERDKLAKRVEESQAFISKTRRVEADAAPAAKPTKTFDQYLDEVTKAFEDDPKEGLKRVVRDMAVDRELERQEYDARLKAAEENAFKKMLALDPEKGKTIREVERLDDERPDLRNLTFEQKLEFISLTGKRPAAATDRSRDVIERERGLGGSMAGDRRVPRATGMPKFVDDPDVLREAQGHFGSKQELADWADPEKARERYMRERKQA